jgi:NADH-quinone oxidoreductase subunit L
MALLEHIEVEPAEEKVITTIGPTVTFRELHDQIAMKDGHTAFLKKALSEKKVWGGMGLVTLACLLLFVGATGKSAQIPLYVWLPDAMAGPTPVSALIHAATMVTAGVYMIARLNFLFSLSHTACGVIALIGASTALFAATIGFFQYDIKKVLAYSTVSQLGFMFIGVGVGAYWAGVFHLMTHAFFKACLFLGSGSVIHGMHAIEHDEVAVQDMRNMGGLKKVMPTTALTYRIACFAITAAPIPFFAGFWSKDEILWKAFTTENTGFMPGALVYVMGLTAALCTSFYMWRSYYLTFEGPHAKKEIPKKVHESPLTITGVLLILAFLSTASRSSSSGSRRCSPSATRRPSSRASRSAWSSRS